VEIVGEIPAGLAPPQWPAVGCKTGGCCSQAPWVWLWSTLPKPSDRRVPLLLHINKDGAQPGADWVGRGQLRRGVVPGFPIGSSLSKSAANDRAGAHSQMSGIIAAGVTVVVALFFTQFFMRCPKRRWARSSS